VRWRRSDSQSALDPILHCLPDMSRHAGKGWIVCGFLKTSYDDMDLIRLRSCIAVGWDLGVHSRSLRLRRKLRHVPAFEGWGF
jgi:hypothetical protein